MVRIAQVCTLFAIGLCATVLAAQNQPATVGGTVKEISADGKAITLSVGSGDSAKEERFKLGPRTKVMVDNKASKLAEIGLGTRVTLSYDKSSKEAVSIKAAAGKAGDRPESRKADSSKAAGAKKGAPSDEPATSPADATATVAAKSVWTTNIAQMKVPDGRASGTILGQEFALEGANLDNGILTLRQGKDFFSDAEIKLFLFLKDGEEVAGKKFRVEAKESFGDPHIHANARPKGNNAGGGKSEQFLNKYAMILEFGKTARGQLPGKIYLCLPDAAKSVIAGHFSVEVFDSTHPLATETLISGAFTVRGDSKDFEFTLSCVGKNQEGKMESPGGGFKIGGMMNSITSSTWAPRFTTAAWDDKKNAGSHKHVNRPPGHYLVFIRGNKQQGQEGEVHYEGYYDWKWVELKDATSKVTADLVVDTENAGTLEVTVTGSTTANSVVYLPLTADGELPLREALYYLQGTSYAKIDGGKAVIKGLREGKYQVAIGPWNRTTMEPSASGKVDVKRGATAAVALNAP